MKRILLFFPVFFVVFSVKAAIYDMVNLTSNDGLSNSSVNIIRQTSNGLMWFGTWDGLNIYNSKEFKTFKPEFQNTYSISNNIIRDIVEEDDETCWITTDLGINRFHIETKTFDRFFSDASYPNIFNENSFFIAKNSENQIFAAISLNGLYYFDREARHFISLRINNKLQFRKIFFDSDDNLWCYTSTKKLYKVVFKKGKFEKPAIEHIVELEQLKPIESVFDYSNDKIWMQISANQIVTYSVSTGILTQVVINNPLASGIIKASLATDEFMFLGSENALYRYNLKTKELETILSNTSVLSLYKGTQGIIWVGTDMQGIWQLSPPKEKFNSYSSSNIAGFGKSAVRTFQTDKNDNLWVGTKGNGIFVFTHAEETDKLEMKSHFSTADGLASNSVFSISQGFNSNFWIGSDGNGINYYDFTNNKINTLLIPDSLTRKINLTSVYCILPVSENLLWVGTSGYGMYKLEINTTSKPYSVRNFKQYFYNEKAQTSLSNNIIYSIIQEDNHHLWIATRGGGLNKFNTANETFQVFKSKPDNPTTLSSNDILTLYKDKKGFLWVGTSMGLNKLIRFENESPVFAHFSEKEGMPNNTIHGILEDRKQSIWVSTNSGIAKLIPEKEAYRIVSYNKKDELQSNEFSDGAAFANFNSGKLYFGGINGFNVFDPQKISQNEYMPQFWLDAFYVDNNEKNISDYMKKGQLVLSYKNKTFSFKFIPLDYLSGSKCEISYLLKGYQSDWIQLGTSNTIVLSNLPSGSYTLRVRSSNADKIWNEEHFVLSLKVTTPWWNSWIARLLYVVLLFLTIWGVWKIVRNQIDAKNSIKLKELEKQKAEEIHQAKLRFFTNIAHEFSNSLTLIYGPCEQLLDSQFNAQRTQKYVNIIKSNSTRMQRMIQQLIDFRKAETGHLKIQIESVDIPELVKYVFDNFLDILEQKKIDCVMDFQPESILWKTDRDSFEKIVFNLISNAVKYTPENEQIKIKVFIQNQNLFLEINNTGVVIDANFQKSIFDRFEVLNRFEKQVSKGQVTRNGIGLALCKSIVDFLGGTIELQSNGESFTTFVVSLPQKEVISEETPSLPITEKPEIAVNKELYMEQDSIENDESVLGKLSGKELVLVVEDEREIRQFLLEFLEEKYAVIEASNGSEAIEMMRRQLPDIVVCDVIMPVMDGMEFVKIMKTQELTRFIPIILLSSRNSIESQISGLEIGADAYLAKPFHPRHLKITIESLLNKNKSLRNYSDSPYAGMEKFEGKILHKEDKDLILKISKIIYDNLEKEELTIDFIAKETALSKIQLYRKIKENLEQTPTEYIRSIRLNHAEKMLKTTNKTVLEIMYDCGFNNKAYFYREFSKKFGVTPKEYRLKKSKQKPE